MGLIILNDFKERNEMILGLRVTVCGSGDGIVIKICLSRLACCIGYSYSRFSLFLILV